MSFDIDHMALLARLKLTSDEKVKLSSHVKHFGGLAIFFLKKVSILGAIVTISCYSLHFISVLIDLETNAQKSSCNLY